MRRVLVVAAVLFLELQVAAQAPVAEVVRIPSGGNVIFGSVFAGDGAGPRPTAILLHGHPGFTVVARGAATNALELAQPLQRAGFNVLAFNYRGAWGSEGRYSIVGRIEDVAAAVTFVKSLAGRFNSDPARLMVVGHSMGGWNALVASIEDRNLNCTVGIAPASYGARRVERIRQGTEPAGVSDPQIGLSGYTGRQQRQEMFANQPRFDVAARMAPLKGRPLLIVQVRQDETVPADEVGEYVDTARAVGVAPFDHVFVDADHNFTLEGNRKELASTVTSWMAKYCK